MSLGTKPVELHLDVHGLGNSEVPRKAGNRQVEVLERDSLELMVRSFFPYANLGSTSVQRRAKEIEAECLSSTFSVRRFPPMSQVLEELRSNVACALLTFLRVMRM